MAKVEETRNLAKEIAELLQYASYEEKLQIKGILIGAKIASDKKKKTQAAV